MNARKKFLCLFFSAGLLIVCMADPSFAAVKSLDEDDDYLDAHGQVVADPIEPWNRAMFTFNDALLD